MSKIPAVVTTMVLSAVLVVAASGSAGNPQVPDCSLSQALQKLQANGVAVRDVQVPALDPTSPAAQHLVLVATNVNPDALKGVCD